MIKHVVILLLSAVTNAEYRKTNYNRFKHENELTMEDPVEAWFPEIEYQPMEIEYMKEFVNITDPNKRLESFGKAAGIWDAMQKNNLKPQRKYEYLMHMAKRFGISHSKSIQESKECEADYLLEGRSPWSMDKIYVDKVAEDLEGAMWIN